MKSVWAPSVAASLLALTLAVPALAQTGAIVQSAPPALAVERLNQNLNRLSRQPTDMEALIGAGNASYELGDAQAANGFFTRANMVNPNDGRVKEGLALVSLALKQPQEAAAYFSDAERLGQPGTAHLAERALAYDLTGQQDRAQRDYAAALRVRPGDEELVRGYAVSLGISGRVEEAEAQLRPLLYKSDRGAWRDRTMILAMNGRSAEARRIAQTVMPKALADAMDPYLTRMGALTPAQKALAVHYGQFPAEGLRLAAVTTPPAAQAVAARQEREREREAGSHRRSRDRHGGDAAAPASAPTAEDSRLLAAMPRADAPPPAAMVQPVPAAPTPVAQPVRTASRDSSGDDDPDGWTAAERRRAERAAATARTRVAEARPVAPQPPAPATSMPRTMQPAPTQANVAALPSALDAARMPAQSASVPPPPRPVASPAPRAAEPVRMAQGPVDGGTPPRILAPVQPAPVAPPATPARTLAQIMADIQVPDAEREGSVKAVDLAEIQAAKRKAAADKAKKEAAAKAKAEADAKAKAEAEEKARIKANPARIWVQIATGRDPAALAFDMRRLRKTYSALADQDAFTAEWGATRRLLIGPFSTQAKAKALLTDLKKAGSDGFVFQSEAGETVDPLSGK